MLSSICFRAKAWVVETNVPKATASCAQTIRLTTRRMMRTPRTIPLIMFVFETRARQAKASWADLQFLKSGGLRKHV